MSSIELSGPVIHVGVALILAFVLRLNPLVTVFCGIFPDLVDKPLAALGIGGGRYVGHTLLFVVVVSAGFFFWKRKYGLAALIGFVSHLLLDLKNLVPWFYPFKDYNFSTIKFNFLTWIKQYANFSELGYELIIILSAVLVALLCRWLYYRYTGRRNRKG